EARERSRQLGFSRHRCTVDQNGQNRQLRYHCQSNLLRNHVLLFAEARHPRISLEPSLADQYNDGPALCESFFDDLVKIRSRLYRVHIEEHLIAESRLELIDQPARMPRGIGAAIA